MKKPIDPNLDNLIEKELLSDAVENNGEPEKAEDLSDVFNLNGTGDLPVYKDEDPGLKIETVDKSGSAHHHHSHSGSHSSSGSHHHSSHSSGGSHHHSSHSSSGGHHHSSRSAKKKKKLSTAAKIAVAVLIILLALIFAVVIGIVYLESHGESDLKNVSQQTDYEEVIEYNGDTYVYNDDVVAIAFIGVDKRELGLENGAVGTAGQADTDIVVTVNTQSGRVKAIAVPRDTMVDVDLYSESGIFLRTENMQLCLSYAYGNGTDTSAANVTTSLSRILYNVPINKYFALDLDGIAPINDAIGGVTVTSLYDFDDLGIKKGDTVLLKGDMTETYVRHRDMDTIDASLNRTERQVQYIKAFAGQLVPAVMQDFSIVSRLYETASDYSSTDISLSNATYLASLLLSKGITDIDFETVTLEGEMKASENDKYEGYVYAEFYPDEDKTLQVVLDTFYTKQTNS